MMRLRHAADAITLLPRHDAAAFAAADKKRAPRDVAIMLLLMFIIIAWLPPPRLLKHKVRAQHTREVTCAPVWRHTFQPRHAYAAASYLIATLPLLMLLLLAACCRQLRYAAAMLMLRAPCRVDVTPRYA